MRSSDTSLFLAGHCVLVVQRQRSRSAVVLQYLESNDSDRDARVGGNEPVREIQKKPRNTDWTVHASTPHEHANACYRIGGDESALLVATHREEWPRRVFQISGRLP